jgi:hypothetical protein
MYITFTIMHQSTWVMIYDAILLWHTLCQKQSTASIISVATLAFKAVASPSILVSISLIFIA